LGTLAEGLQSKYLQPKLYIANALIEIDEGLVEIKEEKK